MSVAGETGVLIRTDEDPVCDEAAPWLAYGQAGTPGTYNPSCAATPGSGTPGLQAEAVERWRESLH